jgi:hypothetical protein
LYSFYHGFFFISSNPSWVKCFLFSVNDTTLLKSAKSKNLLPYKQYLLKNGIMISFMLEKLDTLKLIVPLSSKLV